MILDTAGIHERYIHPIQQEIETADPIAGYELRQSLASYILQAEKGCSELTTEEMCSSAPGGHCKWVPDSDGFVAHAMRKLWGKRPTRCVGMTLHRLQISMPPTLADLRRIDKRFAHLYDKKKPHDLTTQEEHELMFLQALRGEMEADTTKLNKQVFLLEINQEKNDAIVQMIEKCETNPECPKSRLHTLEEKLLSCIDERQRIVTGVKAGFADIGPYMIAFVLMGSLTGVPVSASMFAITVHHFCEAALYCWAAAFGTGLTLGAAIKKKVKRKFTRVFSDPRLKHIQQRHATEPSDLCWPLPRYKWTWTTLATKLYGISGREVGLLTSDVKRLFAKENIVHRDKNGYEYIQWTRLMKHLQLFRHSNKKAPSWTRDNKRQQAAVKRKRHAKGSSTQMSQGLGQT